jgi:glycosyltransferase involved in cell wall biosynthesis
VRLAGRYASYLTYPLGVSPRRLDSDDPAISRLFRKYAPPSNRQWLSESLFNGANFAYTASGRFTPVDFGSNGPDVMHWTSSLPIHARGRPNLYTIHDLVPLRLPFATLDNKRRFIKLSREICARADRVVAVSHHAKDDIVRFLGADADRVIVTHQSVVMPPEALDFTDGEVAREIEREFGLAWRGYFLFFGAIEPKKNLARVIEAYLAANIATPLVIVGGRAWLDVDVHRMMEIYAVTRRAAELRGERRPDRVRQYKYLPRSQLISLIRGARATLLPSLYEGFGLPVLESMLLGTPVLTSTAGSLPEIAGDAALMVDPYDSRAIRRAIQELDSDAALRDELGLRGLAQAARFSPSVYQKSLSELYKPFC